VADALTPDMLLAEAAWLRRLSFSLVGDEDEAEDLVQNSWIAAWKRQPDTNRPLRPWLSKVVLDLSKMGGRGRERREVRIPERPQITSSSWRDDNAAPRLL
jgi:DNA-directed RNA polymerase specialized sigma24 family protein